jgi:tetratricopeptide (TPR) repeat protein
MNRSRAAVLILVLIAGAGWTFAAAEEAARPLEADFQELHRIANAFPPRVETPEEKAKAQTLWRSVEARLLAKLQASPHDFETELQLGDCYRMGHNLDIDGAGDKAVQHLTEAARLDPKSPQPPTLLGQHYSGAGKAIEAESQLLRALSLSGDKPSPAIGFFLAFTEYQLGHFEKTVKYADEYLKTDPDSPAMKLFKDRAEAALRGEFKPKTIHLENDPKYVETHVVREGPPQSSAVEMPSFGQPSFAFYYQNPQPGMIPSLLPELQKQGNLDLAHMAAAGFLAQVFHDHPDRLDEWAPAIWKLDDKARAYVWLSLWFSRTEPAMKLLHDAVRKEKSPDAATLSSLIEGTALPLEECEVKVAAILDLLWGSFYATGRQEYIARIIDCLPWSLKTGKEDVQQMAIGKVAEWSLRENARVHPRVLALCKSELDRHGEEAKPILSKLILAAEKKAE